MKKKTLAVGLCVCLMLSGTGCKGKLKTLKLSDIKEETVLLRKDGSVQSGSYEEFKEIYYEADELKSFMESEIEKYNREHGEDMVTLTKVKVSKSGSKNVARAIVTYHDVETYSKMNNLEAAHYTMSEAKEASVLPDELIVAADGKRINKEKLENDEDFKVLVIQMKGDILLPDTVKYYKNAMLLSANKVETTEDGPAVIIYK